MTERRNPRSYTDKFEQQLVQLYHNGKRKCDKNKRPQTLCISNV